MLKGQEIFKEIAKDMEDIFTKVPQFGEPSIEILGLIAEIHKMGIDHKFPNRSELTTKHLDDITTIVLENKNHLTKEQVHNLYDSIQKMMDADVEHVLNYLGELSEHMRGIGEAAKELGQTLDRACGRVPLEENEKKKSPMMKALGNIFNFRKNNNMAIDVQAELQKLQETKKNKM
jgi:hypothetical protein